MSKGNKTGKGKVRTSAKYSVRDSATGAASVLSTGAYQKTKTNGRTTAGSHRVFSTERGYVVPPIATQAAPRRATPPSLLDPYDWGPDGIPKGKPLRYVLGQGFVVED
jgi:hypothetical protein